MGLVDVKSQRERIRSVRAVKTFCGTVYRLEDLRKALHIPDAENRRIGRLISGHYVLRQRRIDIWTRCSERWVDLYAADALICQYARESASALLEALLDVVPEADTLLRG